MIAGDQVTVTVRVEVEPEVAFDVFTSEIDRWWRRGIAYRVAGRRPGTLVMEPKVGGRLFEQYEGANGPALHVAGTVTVWQPPHPASSSGGRPTSAAPIPGHLAFEWRGSNFAPGEVTYVDVTFTRTESGATELRLVHRGFAALRPDHPVRHGEAAAVFLGRLGRWWGDLLTGLREHATAG